MIQLIKGDCLIEMQNIPDKGIDCIICDLPYGTTACKWDTIIPFEPLWAQYKRVIKDNGAIVLFGSQPFTSALVMSNPKWFRYCWVWEKIRPTGFANAKKRPLKLTEDICIFGGSNYFPQGLLRIDKEMSNSKSTGGDTTGKFNYGGHYVQEFTNYPKNILKYGLDESDKQHPTQKPVALLEYLVKTYTNEGDTVLDNTFGSCTCGVACVNLNRNFIGIEKDENYFRIGEKRIYENYIL